MVDEAEQKPRLREPDSPGVSGSPDAGATHERAQISKESLDADARQLQYKRRDDIEKQYIGLRWFATVLAVVLISGFSWKAWSIIEKALGNDIDNTSLAALATASIFALTAISVFLLMGIFRGPRSDDTNNLPTATAVRTAAEDSRSS